MKNNLNDIPRLDANCKCYKSFLELIRHVFLGFVFFQELEFYFLDHVCLNWYDMIFVKIR
jgi:hypothetical protein